MNRQAIDSAPTFVRIKRKHDVEPSPILLVAGKRQRLDNEAEDFSHIISLAGSVRKMSEIQELALTDCFEQNKKLLEKASHHMSCKRKIELHKENPSAKKYKTFEGEDFQKYHVVDFQEETAPSGLTLNGAEMVREMNMQEDFVYDLYFSNIPFNCVDGLLSVQPYDDVIVDDTEECVIEDDSDDSNQENYYANEYPSTPDDSDDELYGEDELVENFSCFVVDSAEDSDAEHKDWEKYAYNLDATESKQDSD